MKKVLLIALLAMGVMFTFSGQASAQSGGGEAAGAITALRLIDNNPFDSLAAGVMSVYEDVFGPSLGKSMAGLLADTMIMDSMNSAMSPFGGKMIAMAPTHLQDEFASLNLRSGVYGLETQVASGSSKVWIPVSRQEKASLKPDEALSKMTGN